MKAESRPRQYLLRAFIYLLALVVPTLIVYNLYYQWTTPVIDFALDWQTGLILDVPEDSNGNYAGLMAGDIIHTVEGVPLSEWIPQETENRNIMVERDGQMLSLELYIVPLARINLPALLSATIVGLIYWAASLMLLVRRSDDAQVRLLFVLAQVIAVTLLFPLAYPPPWQAPFWLLTLSASGFYLVAPLLMHFYITFPVTLGTPRQRRLVLFSLYTLALLALSTWFVGPQILWVISVIYTILVIGVAITISIYVYQRRATPDGRRRLRLILVGTILAAAPVIFLYLIPVVFNSSSHLPEWLTGLFLIIAPVSYLYAVTRHNLFGIDRLLNRVLVYAILSLGILLIYLGLFLLLYNLLPEEPLLQIMTVAGLTLLVGLAFNWSRTQVQRGVDRIFYGGWYDYPGVVETISNALARSLQREQVNEVLTQQVPELMQLQTGELWISNHREELQTQIDPSALQFTFTLPDERRGLWTVGAHRDGDEFSEGDQRILSTLAHQAEIALNNVILVETLRRQLQEIREVQHQLLRSREEERARLARDLHDGPIQVLVGMNLQLGMLQAAVPPSPGERPASDQLKEMRVEVQDLLGELRQVCAELRPPMLDTLGLGAAIRALADEWSQQYGVPVQLEFTSETDLRQLPDDIGVNLYRVLQEALNNIARHAHAQQVQISLTWQSERLSLCVQDDGGGFHPPASYHELTILGHYGLAGMQERVALIGGVWELLSTPGDGTQLCVYWSPSTD